MSSKKKKNKDRVQHYDLTTEKLKTAITSLNLASGVVGLIAVLEMVTFYLSLKAGNETLRFPNPLYYDFNKSVFAHLPTEVVYYRFASRASSTFDNPLILATFLVVTNPFCAFGSLFLTHSVNRKISRACWVFSTAITSWMFSTTQMVEASRRSFEQMGHTSVSLIL